MILTDTSVVIAYLRQPTTRLLTIIQSQPAAICGVSIAEVFAGARTVTELSCYPAALSAFASVPIFPDVWERLGHHLFALRRAGITVPLTDALIATVALDHGVEVWTYDTHFPLMQSVLSGLRLFQEPP